jgi:glyoxylase-like metal-dependent hydrolase (beta-lactamase superfamily II)
MIRRFDIITIGNISRNRYWGESDEKPLRSAICTCTLVTGDGFRLIADPSIEDANKMAAELDRRSGLKLTQIDLVFVTHAHADHHYGMRHFPQARWLAAPDVAREINASHGYEKPVEAVTGSIQGCIDVIGTPGHTANHHSLRFDCDGMCVVVAGDAVMTRDFWNDRRGYFNSIDPAMASQTIGKLSEIADMVIPGHDNCFLTRPGRRG